MQSVYAGPLLYASVLPLLFIVFTAVCCVDFGRSFQACIFASVGYWAGAVLIMVRRPRTPTKYDLLYVQWGLALLVPIGGSASLLVWYLRGY